ncbi:MAG: tetratricopeptide repeat protein [Chitinophagales bacterium]
MGYLCGMQLKSRTAVVSAIIILLLVVSLFIFRDKVVSFISPQGNAADTLDLVEKLTPEIAALSEKINAEPVNAQPIFQRADAYFAFGNMKYALLDYKKAYSLDSLKQAHAIGLADCYFEINYPDSSLLILEKYLQHDPNNVDVLLDAAIDYYLLPSPKYNLALEHLNTILKTDIQNSEAYFYRAMMFKEMGDTTASIRSFQTAIETDPDNYDAYMQLGMLYADKRDPLAVKYFDNAIALNDSSNEAEYAKAKFMQDVGSMGDAIDYYRKLIVENPQNADAIYNLATVYFGVDSVEKAYRMFELAIKQAPAKPEAYFGKGLCAEDLGKTEEAISFYEQALNLNPNYTDAEIQLKKLKEKQQ